jgi:hypothetical protein
MGQDYELQEDLESDIYEQMHSLVEANPWAWQSIGAVSGLVGGILSPVLGTLLITVTWFIHSEGVVYSLNVLSIVSFVLTIPLLTFGARCLDLLERNTVHLSLTEEQQVKGPVSEGVRDAGKGNRRRLGLTSASVALALLFVLPVSGYAQQTILNMPSSTDVTVKEKV